MKRSHLVLSVLLPLLFGSSLASGGEGLKGDHWAYQPVKRPAVPVVRNTKWVRTPIDAFILAKLEKHGMQPNERADKETLLRRATFDLIGLPPTTKELQEFLADDAPDAFAKVVDRLLASPHYGVRWGRHWLDTARYADTPGIASRNNNFRFPFAWIYRDYVIDAFNSDKPYDQFILEQLAADQLPRGKDDSTLAALGFLTVGERFRNLNDVINEQIDAVSKGFLGLTVTCARCHDHAFDPIPTADYYSLHGIFNSVAFRDVLIAGKRAVIVQDVALKDSPIFIRGQAETKGRVVPRQFLEVLSGPDRPVFKQGSGRLELARAIASKDNPLTARVAINRVWMHHFGEGFVSTPDDLGVQSEPPSHPELIDWLAGYFMDNGWSFKKLHRLIMLSNVYQQSSRSNDRNAEIDRNNRLLWRANVRRLEFEALRDSLLVFSGDLDAKIGGEPFNLTDEPYSFRRSVYAFVDRVKLPDLLQQFNFNDPRMPISKRATTIVPQQALFLMNSLMVVDVTRKIVARKEFVSQPGDTGRIAALYRIIFQREPSADESRLGQAYLADLRPRIRDAASPLTQASDPNKQATMRRKRPDVQPGQNKGEFVERRPLTDWELYAQALLFANELAFVK